MQMITEEDFNKSDINLNKDEEYLRLSTIYRFLLNEYIKELKIGEYENKVSDSNLNFIPILDSKKDFYQYYDNSNLKYYYVRNNIYLERLTEEELKYLSNKQDFIYNDNDRKFVSDTFKKVIKEEVKNLNEPFETSFGPASSTYFAQNNALVIGFRYDKFNDNGMNDDEFEQHYENQCRFYYNLNEQLESELGKVLNMPVSVIEYNDNAVKMLNKKERVL